MLNFAQFCSFLVNYQFCPCMSQHLKVIINASSQRKLSIGSSQFVKCRGRREPISICAFGLIIMVMNRAQKRQRMMSQFLVGNGMQPQMQPMMQPMMQPQMQPMAPPMMQPTMMMHPQQQMMMQQPMVMQPQAAMQPQQMGMGMNHPGVQSTMDDDDDFEQELLDELESQTVPVPAAAATATPTAAPPAPAPTPGHLMGMNPYNTGDDAAISRSSSLLRGLPRRRLTCALEKLNHEMDAGFVSEMSQKGLLILLWLFTRLRPSTKITHLRPLLSNQNVLVLICWVFSFA